MKGCKYYDAKMFASDVKKVIRGDTINGIFLLKQYELLWCFACNSTTVRGEMARLRGTAVRFSEKLKRQTFEWKTDLAESCPPTKTTYDVLKKDHHLSRHIFRPSFAIMWEKGDCAKLRWWPGPRTSPLCFHVRMIMMMMMVMMLLWQFRWRWSWRYWEIKWV